MCTDERLGASSEMVRPIGLGMANLVCASLWNQMRLRGRGNLRADFFSNQPHTSGAVCVDKLSNTT